MGTGRFCALLTAAVVACLVSFLSGADSGAARAQTAAGPFYLQVEAHPTEARANSMMTAYLAEFDNVVGYRLRSSGWHAIAIGPFSERADAAALRLELLRARRIPEDSFVSTGANYAARFWPPADAASARAEAEEAARRAETARVDAERRAALAETERGAAEAAARTEAQRLAADASARAEAARAEAERRAAEALERDETPAQARNSEALLDSPARAEIQEALQWKGYYDLAVDASFGPGTRRAMEAWQADRGYTVTGVLTTRQRAELVDSYLGERAAIGLANWRDDVAGIAVDLPLGMVRFDRYASPFLQFEEIDASGVRVLLISQSGNLATLFGLYEVMQTLEIVPLDGFRERRRNAFLLTGQSDRLRSHTFAQYANGQIKGYTLIWTPERDALMQRVLPAVEASFTTFGGALPDGTGHSASTVSGNALLAGLDVRRPSGARTGFYVDSIGTVVTAADLVESCERITIDETHDAQVAFRDDALGLAVLAPVRSLAPLAFANFRPDDLAPQSEVAVAGFSFEDLLTRPILSFGRMTALEGLNGEAALRRLALAAMPGDAGGPVFDAAGSVVGMLLPRQDSASRVLPEDMNVALSAGTIRGRLRDMGLSPADVDRRSTLGAEELTLMAADMTVLVSCWR